MRKRTMRVPKFEPDTKPTIKSAPKKKAAKYKESVRLQRDTRAPKIHSPKRAAQARPQKTPKILSPEMKRKKARRAKNLRALGVCTIAAVLIYAVIIGVLGGVLFLSIWLTKLDESVSVGVRVSEEYTVSNKTKTAAVPVVTENRVRYLPVDALSRYGGYIHAGDYNSRTIKFSDSGETAVFAVDSAYCTVNDMTVNMNAPAILVDGELYLPMDFFINYVTGIRFTGALNSYTIVATDAKLGYKLKQPVASTQVPVEEAGSLLEFVTTTPVFLSDLTAYERYMNPAESDEFLMLVNPTHAMSETFKPNDLTGVEDQNAAYPGGDYHAKLRLYAAKSLDAMLQEARANGFSGLQATSGYRSYAEQTYRFNALVKSLISSYPSRAEAEIAAVKTVQRPGYSEYQTGLAADVRFPDQKSDTFAQTDAAAWLAAQCYKFGFIVRYPADKSASTGMDYQAWHFRYVGRYHATRMHYLNMSLEEYITFMGMDE